MSSTEEVGTGINLSVAGTVTGKAHWFLETADVLSMEDDELEETIAFVSKGGMTFLSPILPDLKAIVCLAGSRESHLAILSRESAIPCVLAAQFDGNVENGDEVTLDLTDPEVARVFKTVAVTV